MNKFVMVPLVLMMILAVLSFFNAGTEGSYTYIPDQDQITVDGTETNTIYYSGDTGFVFNIFTAEGVILTVVAVVVLGIASGITVVSSGLNSFSVMLIVKSIAVFGLWFALTVMATPIIFHDSGDLGTAIYGIFSFIFAFGFIQEATGGSD